MYQFHQNEDRDYDQFDPDNLDIEDVVKQRWKQRKGNVVGMQNNRLPPFRKRFIDPIISSTRQIEEFLKENTISFKTPDGQLPSDPFLSWDSIKLPPQIKNVIDQLKFRNPTPIQSVVFPLILSGYDVIGVAETGSGKTFGYLIPGLIQIYGQSYPNNFRNQINGPEMLILAPTRELVMQITQQVQLFMRSGDVANAFGGQNRDLQAQQIRQNPTILIACPGRLKDFLDDGIVDLSKVTYLVIDEADRLLDMGFEDDVRYIVSKTRFDRQTVLFSATWPKAVRNLSFDFCAENPIYVQVGRSNLTINKHIDQEIICLYNDEKLQTLLDILDQLKITDKVLIFAETRVSCEQLSNDMTNEGYYAVALHGDKTQKQRDEIMSYYKKGDTKLLCATDLAQRGLDVSDITVVINYDFPKFIDDYIHRIGRTGRAGRKGRAFSFFSFEKDSPLMARELLKLNNIHQIKFNYQLIQEIANGIKQYRDPNTQKGIIKYGGQLMTHQNKSQFNKPNLTQDEWAKLQMQPYQYENVSNRNRQKYNQGQDFQKNSHHGQYNNNRYNQKEENFYQQQFRNQGYNNNNNQRRQQEQNYRSYQQGEQRDFQRQRREDYQDKDNGRQGNQRYQQSRFDNQGIDYQRQNYEQQNNQYDNNRRFQENQINYIDQNRQQNRQSNRQSNFSYSDKDQQFTNTRYQNQGNRTQQFDQFNNDDQKFQQNNYQRQQNYQRDYQFDQQQRDFQNNYRDQKQQQNYRNQNDYQQSYGQRQGFRRDENKPEFNRNQYTNQRQQNNWDNNNNYNNNYNNNNKQGYPQRQNDQQYMKTSYQDNYRDNNFDYQNRTNERTNQDNRRGNQTSWQQQQDNNNNQRSNNRRNFVDVSQQQNDKQQQQIDTFQQSESIFVPNFNNFNNFNKNEDQNYDFNKNPSQNIDFQSNQEQNRRFNLIENDQEQTIGSNTQQSNINRFYDNQKPNSNIQVSQTRLENSNQQQFEQRQTLNNERSQNQSQVQNISRLDRQNDQNQGSLLLDQKMDQSPIENQRQNNERPNFIQQQFQNNYRQSQNDCQSFNRNDRIQDEEQENDDDDDNKFDFTRYSKQVDDNNSKKFELQQFQNSNQQELNNNRKNSNQQQIQDSEQNNIESQVQY